MNEECYKIKVNPIRKTYEIILPDGTVSFTVTLDTLTETQSIYKLVNQSLKGRLVSYEALLPRTPKDSFIANLNKHLNTDFRLSIGLKLHNPRSYSYLVSKL